MDSINALPRLIRLLCKQSCSRLGSIHSKTDPHARTHGRLSALTMVVFGLLSALLAQPSIALESVEVFTDPAMFPVVTGNITTTGAGSQIIIHDLSARKRLLDEISQGLPSDPAQAKTLAMARLNAGDFRQRLVAAEVDAALATQYGIVKLPAIVFDRGAAVAYGLTDVGQAFELYRRWQGAVR